MPQTKDNRGPKLRLAFMGTPDFAVPALQALHGAGHVIAAVYTQPPRPSGRGHKMTLSPVQREAERLGLTVRHPNSLRSTEESEVFRSLDLDVAVVAAYGLILPKPVLEAPALGCVNIHASLLPRWRGAAPIQRALLAGDSETGITIMQMDDGLDTGGMLLQESLPIGPATTAADLHDALAAMGSRMIVTALGGLAAGSLRATPQPAEGATYAHKLQREEGRLDWTRPATFLERQVRALNPAPGVWFDYAGERIKVLAAAAEPLEHQAVPGAIVDDQLGIATAAGLFRPLQLQREGRQAIGREAFLHGLQIPAGVVLPCPATS